eukprot:CAMPEP_0197324388 /NCGR_PEP_ID=MMETSP0891-20130614/71074_1 /TAXON_ID=44058 ORGANISM="Aureoumbra lagunensis, Strain CCMP1510" /NCGR_SAMPLE_ID=MMETSP0891 /ASSEMBLY_ACC=CAM_ASM_000534 /LENGTH=90 /DNA_ID=CAMNT_0042817189 /DNA_START=12 /DNA_END=284 /DNA_ORIENTATION=+
MADESAVANAQNYEDRVNKELLAQRQWIKDWGSLYAPDEPLDYFGKIAQLEERTKLYAHATAQSTNSDYGNYDKQYPEFKQKKVKKPDII